ncbi:MAG TPA: cysteine desulfurase family protein [Xanthobacteraceae bacterium]
MDRSYLDWNATAPLRPAARAALARALEGTGNPSSVHGEGRTARRLIESARQSVAALVGAEPGNVVFTSGGTEANMLALTPHLQVGPERAPRDRLLVSAIEHPSVGCGGRFAAEAVSRIAVSASGALDLGDLQAQLSGAVRPLVSIMLANNETGVLQPVRAAAEIVHAAGGILHVDAVQAAGRMAVDITALGADLMTLSAHKIGGPQGVGALLRRDQSLHFPDPLLKGGGQERGLRAGTENVAAIAGFGAAAAELRAQVAAEIVHLSGLRDRLEAGLRAIAPETVIFGADAARVPNTTLFALAGIKAETALIALDLAGIAVSSGSACSSGKVAPSHVLAAMGVAPELARGAIRISTGYGSTAADIDRFLQAWRRQVESLLKGQHVMAA